MRCHGIERHHGSLSQEVITAIQLGFVCREIYIHVCERSIWRPCKSKLNIFLIAFYPFTEWKQVLGLIQRYSELWGL